MSTTTKVKLITDAVDVNDVKLISEGEKDKSLYIEGIFSSAENLNINGRKYKKKTLEREMQKLEETIKAKKLYGELNHPNSPDVNLERSAILIENLEWKDNHVWGKAKVLSTPMGEIIKGIIRDGGAVGISSRGLGSVDEDGYVNDKNYKLITWDIVGRPSNNPSWVKGIYEGAEWSLESGKMLAEGDDEENHDAEHHEEDEKDKEKHHEEKEKFFEELKDLMKSSVVKMDKEDFKSIIKDAMKDAMSDILRDKEKGDEGDGEGEAEVDEKQALQNLLGLLKENVQTVIDKK